MSEEVVILVEGEAQSDGLTIAPGALRLPEGKVSLTAPSGLIVGSVESLRRDGNTILGTVTFLPDVPVQEGINYGVEVVVESFDDLLVTTGEIVSVSASPPFKALPLRAREPVDRKSREYAWMAAHIFIIHASFSVRPCRCEFCVWYRNLHGDDVDPWVGPWSGLTVKMR